MFSSKQNFKKEFQNRLLERYGVEVKDRHRSQERRLFLGIERQCCLQGRRYCRLSSDWI